MLTYVLYSVLRERATDSLPLDLKKQTAVLGVTTASEKGHVAGNSNLWAASSRKSEAETPLVKQPQGNEFCQQPE